AAAAAGKIPARRGREGPAPFGGGEGLAEDGARPPLRGPGTGSRLGRLCPGEPPQLGRHFTLRLSLAPRTLQPTGDPRRVRKNPGLVRPDESLNSVSLHPGNRLRFSFRTRGTGSRRR